MSKKVLLVDDNPKNIQVLANTLMEMDYDIDFAENGQDALEIIEEEDFDLILMDVMMPVMDGYTACEEIKKLDKKKDIPLIFLTAKTDKESVSRGFEVGGVDYVSKPFNANELMARVKTHIELKDGRDKLKNMNVILEQKVEKRTEELRKAKEELEELDHAKTSFLKMISHEIRTPLNGILGFSSLLKDLVKDELELQMIETLDDSCKRLEQFSISALDISALKIKGTNSLVKKDRDIKTVIENVLKEIQGEVVAKRLVVSDSCEKSNMKIDSYFLQKGISIVLSNAIKHSSDLGNIAVTSQTSDSEYSLRIKDEGRGFPDVILDKGVKPFNTTEHLDDNPSIDLYLCQLIIEAHEGQIHFSNDQGAVVDITLPIVKVV